MLDVLCAVLFFLLLMIAVLSLIPFRLDKGLRSRCFALPLLGIFLYGIYETAMAKAIPSESVPIRVDVLLLWPVLGFIMLAGLVRAGIVGLNRREAVQKLSPSVRVGRDRRMQLFCVIPLLVVVAAVAYFVWCNI